MSFEWCNGTHYGGPDDIVPILDVMDCSVSWIQPPTHQNWICKTLYPPGWTCAQGLFNTDLLAFNVEDIEDCELLEVLSVIDVLSMEALDEWDYICEDMHTQDNGYVNLDPLVLDMSVNPLSTRVFYECNDPKRNPGRFSITWVNDTHMEVGGLVMPLDDEWTCELADFIPSLHRNLCTGAWDYGRLCHAGVIDVNLLTKNTAWKVDCMLWEVTADFEFDKQTAQTIWNGICSDIEESGRKLDYYDCCGIENNLGPQKSQRSNVGFGKAASNTHFHFHFYNLQDLRWCNTLPIAGGMNGCFADPKWVMPSKWYRPFWSMGISLYKKAN